MMETGEVHRMIYRSQGCGLRNASARAALRSESRSCTTVDLRPTTELRAKLGNYMHFMHRQCSLNRAVLVYVPGV